MKEQQCEKQVAPPEEHQWEEQVALPQTLQALFQKYHYAGRNNQLFIDSGISFLNWNTIARVIPLSHTIVQPKSASTTSISILYGTQRFLG